MDIKIEDDVDKLENICTFFDKINSIITGYVNCREEYFLPNICILEDEYIISSINSDIKGIDLS